MEDTMKTPLILAFALSLLSTGLHAQVDDATLSNRTAVNLPTLTPTLRAARACVTDASEARFILDRATRYDDEAALDYLIRVRDSVEAVVRDGDADDLFVLAAVRGAEATLEGGTSQVRAAEAAFRHSQRVLELEPGHAGAAYVLGRLNAGVMRTSRITRFLASRLMGGDALGDASWDEARRLLEIAVEARPCDAEYRYELGRVYADLDLVDLALEQLDHAVGSPDRGSRARAAKDAAREFRDGLRREGSRMP
jgi:tetratricopeptide (TPR) repeat protein